MNEFDVALKNLLQRQLEGGYLSTLTGLQITEWLGTELDEVRTRRADLLGRTRDRVLVHLELQATHDPKMALRMAEYALAIYRRYGSIPVQIVMYLGQKSLRMESALQGPGWSYRCQIVDIRDMPTESLLESDLPEDNVLAILTRFADQSDTVHRILTRIAGAPADKRQALLSELTLVAGLRKLRAIIGKEIDQMPILLDLKDHNILGPPFRKGLKQGRQEGQAKGREQGREQGERRLASIMLTHRFGALPPAVLQHLEAMSSAEIEQMSDRILTAATLDDLFGSV